MSTPSMQVAIIGAGPYGLSAAAYLRAAGIRTHQFGETMAYTCAYWHSPETTLDEAQTAKFDMICRKLRLQPGDRMLDIGSGWAGLICHAAQHYGVTAHGVTLAQEQFDFTQERIARLGLQGKVTVELKDYREVTGTFDKIASIGMFEHVGLDNHDAYFIKIHSLLRPRGLYLHHAITFPYRTASIAVHQ